MVVRCPWCLTVNFISSDETSIEFNVKYQFKCTECTRICYKSYSKFNMCEENGHSYDKWFLEQGEYLRECRVCGCRESSHKTTHGSFYIDKCNVKHTVILYEAGGVYWVEGWVLRDADNDIETMFFEKCCEGSKESTVDGAINQWNIEDCPKPRVMTPEEEWAFNEWEIELSSYTNKKICEIVKRFNNTYTKIKIKDVFK